VSRPTYVAELVIRDTLDLGLYVSETQHRGTALEAVQDAVALIERKPDLTLGDLVDFGHEDAYCHLPTGVPRDVARALPVIYAQVVRYHPDGGDMDDDYTGPTVTLRAGRAFQAESAAA
jgi:hypothetical protein